MIDQTVTTIIDQNLCNGCGLCIKVCPKETISMQNRKAVVTGTESLSCGHCAAICPRNAITVQSLDPGMISFKTFSDSKKWIRHGDFDTGKLVSLMRSRRSCRNFKDNPVSRDMLEDLVKIGITAPSGSNFQGWTFTILSERKDVLKFTGEVYKTFKRINELAENNILRVFMKLIGKKEIDEYYKIHYTRFKERISSWESSGEDSIFYGAPSVILVGYKPDAPCPSEDSLLATQNIILAAHSMGLGTCLIGFAVTAIKRNSEIKKMFGIPKNEKIYSVIAIGYPDEKYIYPTGRKKAEIRFYNS